MSTTSRTVFLSLSRGYFLRLFEHSGLVDRLVEDHQCDVVFLVPPEAHGHIEELFAGRNQVRIERLILVQKRSLRDRIYRAGLYKFSKYRQLSKLWFKSELIWNDEHVYDDLFDKYEPRLVVTASAGKHAPEDPQLIRNARRRSIRTLCLVWSWDNLAMSGPVAARSDHLGVWNNRMFDDATGIQKFRRDEVSIVGVPQFDHYFSTDTFLSRADFMQEMGLDPEKKLITVATAPMRSVADHRFLVRLMIEKVSAGEFGDRVQLLFRPHPMEDPDFYSEFSESGQHRFDFSARESKGLDWTPDRQDNIHLANVLFHTDVLVNIASTVTLEAAILDTPIVNVAFSLSEPERFAVMVLKNHYGAHFKHVFDANASKIVHSEIELATAVRALLDNPSLLGENRRNLALATCDRLDGSGSDRAAELIASMATA